MFKVLKYLQNFRLIQLPIVVRRKLFINFFFFVVFVTCREQELPKVDEPDILYYMLQCLHILCLHGDALTKASKDHLGFLIWCQENLLIKKCVCMLLICHYVRQLLCVPVLTALPVKLYTGESESIVVHACSFKQLVLPMKCAVVLYCTVIYSTVLMAELKFCST